MGEKFGANPVTGTGAVTVPVYTSPGRSGFGPQLSLSYDSAAGNGPFGFGWSLTLPSITRKTDKGLPRYDDDAESDVFLVSGAEDLVPLTEKQADAWKRVETTRTKGGKQYRVHCYRPRIEGPFARIERWTSIGDPTDMFWRSLSGDNVLTLYGKDPASRIADPEAPGRIFSWLICETRDDRGNAILYEYKAEDGAGVDITRPQESNRGTVGDPRRSANRYLKRIRYGNRVPLLDGSGSRPFQLDAAGIAAAGWMFEAVVDYGEHDIAAPGPQDSGSWRYRDDAFSTYRAGFEVRTTRLAHRIMMFHHFAEEDAVGAGCLVRSTDFVYSDGQNPGAAPTPLYAFLRRVTQSGYRRAGATYLKRSLPPLDFVYSEPVVQSAVQTLDAESLENLPIGVDGSAYRWIDLHGEGMPGILTEQGGAWFYKRNLGAMRGSEAGFAPAERVASKPKPAFGGGVAQFMDLAGDGQLDLALLDGPTPGFYKHDDGEDWYPFRPFAAQLNRDFRDPNLRFVDLDGDGRADVLISEDNAFVWHASLGETGFGNAVRVRQALDEEKGPRFVFGDATGSIYLADLSGDGLADLVRIRNGDICYWPNLGYGRFGAKVTMDNAPRFDSPDQFDRRRIRLADIDGSGTTDLIYLHRDGVRLCFNQSGNGWSAQQTLPAFPPVDNAVSILPTDLGNGTASLVWSSPLPGDAGRQMRYVDLMGGTKPHLLIKMRNGLGTETHVTYAPSTKFYLNDKAAGKPWITRLPFPVHVVEKVETVDYISRNRFCTRYAYHHGYFDGAEREFRGFGMVEQWDAESIGALPPNPAGSAASNLGDASNLPPIHVKTWFHTGIYLGREHVSDFFAGLLDPSDPGEYYREPQLDDDQIRARLLPDTVLPRGLTIDEEREACRALKGSMLRREVYAMDATDKISHPYTVTEQNFDVRCLQPRGGNRHAAFFTHPRESLLFHYERNPADPRIQHALTLEVDDYGNVLKDAAIGYGRRQPDPDLPLQADRDQQAARRVVYSEDRVTNPIDDRAAFPDDHRLPLPCETQRFELTGYMPTGEAGRYRPADFVEQDPGGSGRLLHVPGEAINYEDTPAGGVQRRLIEHLRILYRPNDLGSAGNDPLTLLPLGMLESLAFPGESYKLAFTPGLLGKVFRRNGQPLLSEPARVLGGHGADGGGYVDLDGNQHWWASGGRVFFSPGGTDTAAQELAFARRRFFLPARYRDPHGATTTVFYDRPGNAAAAPYDLLISETVDPLGNRVTVGERLQDGTPDPAKRGNDYRVLQPWLITDPNRNRTLAAFDTLGLVVATAVKGRDDTDGDDLRDLPLDLTDAQIEAFYESGDPHAVAPELLKDATTRIVYDIDRFCRSQRIYPKDPTKWQPAYAATLARETHSGTTPPPALRIQISFSYSDGFGREIQKKIQAEPGPVIDAGPIVDPRWVGSGWTIFNNKGKPVRQFEPFFSVLAEKRHHFEFGTEAGVSPILFYDPAGRVLAILHPDHSYEKVVFGPWQQVSYDVNDTVFQHGDQTGDPRTDPDIRDYVGSYFAGQPSTWQTWYAQRESDGDHAAAAKAAAHTDTPTRVFLDTLGRTFLTLAHNGFKAGGSPDRYATRVELDIQGNQTAMRDASEQGGDARGRIVMRYAHDMLGNRIHQISMEAGARWMLADVAGKPIRAWDSRGQGFRTEYDPLRRPLGSFVIGADPADPGREILAERLVYGEQHPENERRCLRTRAYLHLDQAGASTSDDYDFKGNLQNATRRIAREYKQAVDWSSVAAAVPANPTAPLDLGAMEAVLAPLLEPESYRSGTTYDALNRPMTVTMPRSDVIRFEYNEANLLERVEARMHPPDGADHDPPWKIFVANIDYDAKGRRTRIDYGNAVSTLYGYDRLTSRLVRMMTQRNPTAFPADCTQPPPVGWPGCQVQNLRYSYDPIGNILSVRDDAQQAVYFRNRRIDPSTDYTYDALYRLTEARGREHLGQNGQSIVHSYNDALRIGLPQPGDGGAMGNYLERYVYDAVGNLLEMQHRGDDVAAGGWRRSYDYSETSLIEDGTEGRPLKSSNRLTGTAIADGGQTTERYQYDSHGNMIRLPHLGGADSAPNLRWNFRDQLSQAELGGGGTAYYVYDAAGRRVRKVCERPGNLVEERIYLSGFEIFRRRQGATRLERESLHIMDDRQRIALVETRTIDTAGGDRAPQQLIRYQFGNHLGSACLELDDEAKIISYEEYAPYGSTTYQAVRASTETPKRYRYTGMERDEETGLNYHTARYYAPWLGRWTSCDPAGVAPEHGLYTYTNDSPTKLIDPKGTSPEWINKTAGSAKEFAARTISSAHAVIEGAIWNPTITGAITRAERQMIDFQRGKILEKWAGNIKGFPGALGPTAKDADRALRTTVEQIKTSYVRNVAKVVENATEDAARFIAANAAHMEKEARAVLILPSGTPKSAIDAAKNAVAAIRGSVAAPKVVTGLPGVGVVLKSLAPIGAAISVAALPGDIKKGDIAAAFSDAAGFVAGGMTTAVNALSYFGGTGASGSTALIGPGGAAGVGLATGASVVGAFAAGSALGIGIDQTLNVSEYSSQAGAFAYEKLRDAGLNDNASYVLGAAASVAAILPAIGYAAAAKVDRWLQ